MDYIYWIFLFIHPLWNTNYFHILATENMVLYMGIQMYLCGDECICFECTNRRGISEPYGSSIFYFFVILGFELRASCLWHRHFTVWANPCSPFYSGYFWNRILLFDWLAQLAIQLFYTACCLWDNRYIPPCTDFSTDMGSCELGLF
jgi:hypothetical protein